MERAQLRQPGMAGPALGVPFRGEAAGRDVVDQLAHARQHVEMIERAPPRQLAVLAGRRVEVELPHESHLAQQAVVPLHLARQVELGEDGLDRDAALEERRDEGAAGVRQHGRQRLLDGEIEDGLLVRRHLDRALAQAADRLGDREDALQRVPGAILVHAERGDEPAALHVAAAHLRAQHARRDQPHVAAPARSRRTPASSRSPRW